MENKGTSLNEPLSSIKFKFLQTSVDWYGGAATVCYRADWYRVLSGPPGGLQAERFKSMMTGEWTAVKTETRLWMKCENVWRGKKFTKKRQVWEMEIIKEGLRQCVNSTWRIEVREIARMENDLLSRNNTGDKAVKVGQYKLLIFVPRGLQIIQCMQYLRRMEIIFIR